MRWKAASAPRRRSSRPGELRGDLRGILLEGFALLPEAGELRLHGVEFRLGLRVLGFELRGLLALLGDGGLF